MVKIFVGSIRDYITQETLTGLFSPYGNVEAIMHKGSYAFVFMPSDDEANAACQALHRTEVQGCTMNVEIAKPSAVGEKPVFSMQTQASTLAGSGGGNQMTNGNGPDDSFNLFNNSNSNSNNNDARKRNHNTSGSNQHNNSSFLNAAGGPRKHPKFHHIAGWIKLIIGNIGETTQEELHQFMTKHGSVRETYIMAGKGVGFCHVDEIKAEFMIEATHNTELNGNSVRVTYSANKDLKRKPDSMTQYVKLYVPGIAEEASEDMIRARFEMFGDVKDIHIHKKHKDGSSSADKTCVVFMKIDSSVAEYAIHCLTNIPFYGKPLRPQIAKGESMAPVQVLAEANKSLPAPNYQAGGQVSGYGDQQQAFGQIYPAGIKRDISGHPPGMQGPPPNFPRQGPPFQQPNLNMTFPPSQPMMQANHPQMVMHSTQIKQDQQNPNNSFPTHHELASLEIGPGFGPNGSIDQTNLPPAPENEQELREIIRKRCKLEMVHPYEKVLIESYTGDSKKVPDINPTPEFLRLIRDRAILKVQLLRAQNEKHFDVYGTAAKIYSHMGNSLDPYGFGQNGHEMKVEADQVNNSNEIVGAMVQAPGTDNSYSTAYANNMSAGGPITLRKEFVPRRAPY